MPDPTKPNLLVLASTYPRWANDSEPGFVHELCRRLTPHFNVIALVPDAADGDPSGVLDGVEVVRFRYAPKRWQTLAHSGGIVINLRRHKWKWLLVPLFIAGQYLAARRVTHRRRIAVIHAHWLIPQGLIARRLSRLSGAPYLVTSHGGDLFGLRGRLATSLKRRVARDAAIMTVVSSAMRDEVARLGLAPQRLEVLPMGVDLQRFAPDDALARKPGELLFVGRLVPKKGLRHLVAAMPGILERIPAVVLSIVGSGPEEEPLKAQAKEMGVEHAVIFLGPKRPDELPSLYRQASLFVSPFVRDESGDQEGLPVALMEAIACGCPAVVGDVPGIRDLLGDAANETCVDATDEQALRACVLRQLEDPVAARERAVTVRERVVHFVDWNRIAANYAGLLRDAVNGVPSGVIQTMGRE